MDEYAYSSIDKTQELIRISDEILADLEAGIIPLEQIVPKCLRAARLRDDFDAIKWFTLELSGYSTQSIIPGISEVDIYRSAKRSGRFYLVEDKQTGEAREWYRTQSVAEIEAEVLCNQQYFDNLRTPTTFQPAISKKSYNSEFGSSSSETVVETYGSVLFNIRNQKESLSAAIKSGKALLSAIRSNVYGYILDINYQAKFENITESIFQETKKNVDLTLARLCPDAIRKFVAAYERLHSDNPEEWSQAMSSCRNILKEFADAIFPAQRGSYKKRNGEVLKVTDKEYKNRLLAFIDGKATGDKNRFLSSRVSDLEKRIHTLNDLLSRGTHDSLDLTDVRICVLDTYLLIGSLLGLTSPVDATRSD